MGGRIESLKFPERRSTPAGGQSAEYQKSTYDHHHLVVSPDGTKMALSGRHVEKEPSASPDQPEKIKRDRAGKPIVTENILEVIDVATGRSLVAFKPPTMFENLALSPDNRFLAAETSAQPGVVFALHLPSRKSKQFNTQLRRILPGGLVFAKDGRSIHALAADRLKTIDLAKGDVKELKFELSSPAASYNAELNLVAVGVSRSKEGKPEVQIYDVTKQTQSERLAVPAGPTSLQFSADGKFLAVVVAGGAVGVWQTSDWSRVGSVTGQIGYDAGPLAVSADGQLVAVLPRTGRGETRIVDIGSRDRRQSLATRDAAFLRSGDLAVASANGPFYLSISSGALTELPAGAGLDPASPEATAVAGQESGTAAPAVGYGAVVDTAAQTPPTTGYGVTSPPAVGYGASPPQNADVAPSSDQSGYGRTSPPPSAPDPSQRR
jgi:hypothetical protein